MDSICEQCMYYEWDDELEEYSCVMTLDEDELQRFSYSHKSCPYFRFGDEYQIVKKQN